MNTGILFDVDTLGSNPYAHIKRLAMLVNPTWFKDTNIFNIEKFLFCTHKPLKNIKLN